MKTVIMNGWGYNAHSHHMKAILGLSAKAKLPAEGVAPQMISAHVTSPSGIGEGITRVKVWVAPLDPTRSARRVHRVRAECPRCLKEMSAGRLFSHVCVDMKKTRTPV